MNPSSGAPWNCAVLCPLSPKTQFAGLLQSTLKVSFFPGEEEEKCTASDRGGEENVVDVIVIRKNNGSL